MADRFVPGGTIGDEPKSTDERRPLVSAESHKADWESVQRELAAERKKREEARAKAAAGEEKSLYDILQANKAAKQAAFEEKLRLKNQFRALDDDEADFLDEGFSEEAGQ
ncbi:putative NEFA-interacting nuclear protein NIP30 [Ophiocordyceps camponoti-floridani]|uniref:Putative NEFA-interacting nuclear protein NIP30 n=1 Tax=Ophiocordyceps camponoti-floridani TaxID=2030778 RepID=A0A8H4Q4K5_9HYPO|nr:putative NEFA-interacting nuclear protein NIP30 [Ophiocordyceps camponoti-floridani]